MFRVLLEGIGLCLDYKIDFTPQASAKIIVSVSKSSSEIRLHVNRISWTARQAEPQFKRAFIYIEVLFHSDIC